MHYKESLVVTQALKPVRFFHERAPKTAQAEAYATQTIGTQSGIARGGRKVTDKLVVLVTCSSSAEARRIARAVVEARLAACVNILPGAVISIYRWKGKMESAKERLLLIKTSRKRLEKLRTAVMRLHSYDVPEFIALRIDAGSAAYLAWLEESLT